MREGEMLEELLFLLQQLKDAPTAEQKEVVTEVIIQRHALPWFDGDVDEPSERLDAFKEKARFLLGDILPWASNPQEVEGRWIRGICAIDEGYEPNGKPLKEVMEALDYKDIVRHFLNGGTTYGIGKNIKSQIEEIIDKSIKWKIRNAEKRWKSGGNIE